MSKPPATWDSSERPKEDEYGKWLKATHNVELSQEKLRYESASAIALQAAKTTGFWNEFQAQRRDLADAYLQETRFQLFAFQSDDEPKAKSWASFLHKSYRRNVLNNTNWPHEPSEGWLLPATWLTAVHDIVRTSVVVKYLDGVEFLTSSFFQLAEAVKTPFEFDFQARDTGYYASHTYTKFAASVPDETWQARTLQFDLEIQITTQLQEVIGRLTHDQYEKRRSRPAALDSKWQWDHKSPEFQPNYLGHLLHYAEGMIMEVRDRDFTK